MKRLLTGFCALALSAGLLTACSESRTDRVGDKPGERTPSASPPTATTPSTPPSSTTPGGSGTSSGSSSTSPSGSTSSPSGTGTK